MADLSNPSRPGATPQQPAESPSGMGKYRLIAELGRGGMADVYLAVAAGPGGFNKLLVIKQLRMVDDPSMVTMFLDEAKLAARVSHPNIVQTFEVAQEASRAYMVMEFLDGPSLSRLRRAAVKQGERVPLGIELHIMREALLGLHSAHELRDYDGKPLNVVHRDFTPQNIMTTYAGDAKIVDFGIAKALDQEGKTSAGVFKGKLSYVPPEQLMGAAVDRRTDVFAAGVMLYEAVTGASPWQGKTNAQITHELASGNIPRLMENEDAPAELAAIIDQAMAIDPDDRYETADELRLALDEFIREHKLELDRAKLGTYVTSVLGDAKEITRRLIEHRLREVNSLPSAETLNVALPTLDSLTPSPAAKQVGRSLPQMMASDQMPDTGRGPSPDPVSVVTVASPMTRVVLGGLGVVVLALVVVVGFLVSRSPAQPVAVVATPVVAPAAVTPAPAPVEVRPVVAPEPVPAAPPAEAKLVTMRFSASPSTARLFLDALQLPSNPYEGSFPADDRLHELRASAPGHVEVRRGIALDRDLSIDLTLSREVAAGTASRRPTPPAPTPTAPAKPATGKTDDPEYFAPASGEKKQPKRSLDNVEFE